MKKNSRKMFIIIFILSILSCNGNYVRFKPISYDYNLNQYCYNDTYSEEYKKNFIKVLNFFEEDYQLVNNELYINKELSKDREWLWNLCRKANDNEWLEKEWVEYYSDK